MEKNFTHIISIYQNAEVNKLIEKLEQTRTITQTEKQYLFLTGLQSMDLTKEEVTQIYTNANTSFQQDERKMYFIKNTLDCDVDGLKQVNTYKVSAMYNKQQPEGHYEIKQETLKVVSYTWDEIVEMGGVGEVVKGLKKEWGIA